MITGTDNSRCFYYGKAKQQRREQHPVILKDHLRLSIL
jgi:hypothetical protein